MSSRLVLDATTKSITAVLGGAVATTQPDFTAHYADATTTTFIEGANDGTLNSTTPVTLVAAPAASTRRTIVALTVVNRDTAPVTLTVNYVSAGGTRVLWTGTLAVGASWTLDTSSLSLDHALMTHLAYADAGHTGFQPTITTEVSGPIAIHAELITGVHGLVFTAGKTLTLTESLTLNALPVGGLAVATGANTLGSLAVGLATQVLIGGGAGTVPAWAADLPTAVTIGSGYIYRASGTDVPVADGGTGASTLALNGVLYGNAASAIGVTAIGAQYQVLTVGASPFVPAFSSYLLDGTAGGKTIFAVTNTKTLTLTATDDYNLTIPATGTAALLNQANSFTLINPLTTIAESWIGPSATAGIYFKSGNAGFGTITPTARIHLAPGTVATTSLASSLLSVITFTDVSGSDIRGHNIYTGLAAGAASSASVASLYIAANANSAGGALTGIIYGTRYQVYTSGANNITSIRASNLLVEHYGSGVLTNMYGSVATPIVRSGGGNVTSAYGFLAAVANQAASTITTAAGFYVDSAANTGGGTITNNYGIYIAAQTVGTANHAIYTNAGLNRLGDQLTITGSADRQQLTVTGYSTQAVSTGVVGITRADAAAGVSQMLTLTALGSGADGDGGSLVMLGKSSTTAAQSMGLIEWYWPTGGGATHASRFSRLVFSIYDAAGIREGLRLEASGSAAKIGFLGAAAVVQQTGHAAPTDLATTLTFCAAIRTALQNFGLITTV